VFKVGIYRQNRKDRAIAASSAGNFRANCCYQARNSQFSDKKTRTQMNKLALTAAGLALLSLAACGRGDQDRLDEAQVNQAQQENLDQLANDAANLATETEALESQAEQLNQRARELQDSAGAQTEYDENIAGM
jgi:outer membrane murein-binding lipoprotein Lpp